MNILTDPQYRTQDGSALRIWRDTAQNNFLSEREGRPIFDEVIYAEVISPGSRDSTPTFELERIFAKEMGRDAPKYGAKYNELREFVEHFKRDEKQNPTLSGTPLDQWPEMNRSLIAQLRAQGVFTVDALAELSDTKLLIVGPDGRAWREKAKAYVENAKNGAFATELAARVDQMQTELEAGKQREAAMAARIQELETASANVGTALNAPQPVAAPSLEPII